MRRISQEVAAPSRLRPDPALQGCSAAPLDRYYLGCRAQIRGWDGRGRTARSLPGRSIAVQRLDESGPPGEHHLGGTLHLPAQPFQHIGVLPLLVLDVLRPLEVGDHDAAGIRQDVGKHFDATIGQDVISRRGDRAVGGFDYQPGIDALCVVGGDLVFDCCRDEDVTLRLLHCGSGQRRCAGKADHGARFIFESTN